MSPWRDVELEASLAGYRWAPRTPVCPHAASLHVDFPLPACLWIWQHLFTVLVGFFVSHWLLTHKAFPSSFPWLEQHPQRPGCSRGGHCTFIAKFWWSHNFRSAETRQTGTASEQICPWGFPLLLAPAIPGMTFCIWTRCRIALVRWSQQCLYKSQQNMTGSR